MQIEPLILYISYSICFILLAYIPKDKWREASITFVFHQFTTWFLGLLVVELRLIEYPVRVLADVTRSSFLFEFLAFPVVGIFYCIYFPVGGAVWKKFLYTCVFVTALTIPEITLEKYTDVIHYIKWEWYITWISVFTTLYLLGLFHRWFFRI